MAEFSSPASGVWDSYFKRVYAKGVLQLIPEAMWFQKSSEIQFIQEKKLGDSYEQPIESSLEQGMTYGGSDGSAFALETAVSSESGNARVKGSEMVLRGRISKAALARSTTSEAAFVRGSRKKVEGMTKSHAKRLEIELMHGLSDTGIGVCASQTGSSTTRAWVLTDATWSAGIWAGMKNAVLEVRNSANSYAKLNSNADVLVTGVNLTTKTVSVSGNSSDLTAIDAAITTAVLYFKGSYTNGITGLDKIATTSSGNLFSLAVSDLWKSSTYAVSGNPTMTKILEAMNQGFELGMEDDCVLVLPGKAYNKLNLNESALRKYDVSYSKKKLANGSEQLVFIGHAGEVTFQVHRFCKDGEAFLFPKAKMKRIGAYDGINFDDGVENSPMLHRVEGYNGFEIRSYSDQALFCEQPSALVKLTGLSYT